jgi:hypothetical protein
MCRGRSVTAGIGCTLDSRRTTLRRAFPLQRAGSPPRDLRAGARICQVADAARIREFMRHLTMRAESRRISTSRAVRPLCYTERLTEVSAGLDVHTPTAAV